MSSKKAQASSDGSGFKVGDRVVHVDDARVTGEIAGVVNQDGGRKAYRVKGVGNLIRAEKLKLAS